MTLLRPQTQARWMAGSEAGHDDIGTLMGNTSRRGFMLVLSSPSGAGKTTLARRLLEIDNNIAMSVSVTTRPRRATEVEGRDYFFVHADRFEQMVRAGELGWSAERVVVIEFPNMAAINSWYSSPEYQPLIELRKACQSVNDLTFFMDGT